MPSCPPSICAAPRLCTGAECLTRLVAGASAPFGPPVRLSDRQRAFRWPPVLRHYLRPAHLHCCPPGSTAGTGRRGLARGEAGSKLPLPHGNRGRHPPHGSSKVPDLPSGTSPWCRYWQVDAGSSVEAGSKAPFRTEATLMALDDVAGIGQVDEGSPVEAGSKMPLLRGDLGTHLPHVSFALPHDLHGSSHWCRWREASSWLVHWDSPAAATA